jgi:hypothetical protein
VSAFNAPFYGSADVGSIVGIAYDSTTGGYWEVGSDGGIYAFHAPFDGSLPGVGVDVNNIVGMAGG